MKKVITIALLKKCSWRGCTKIINNTKTYCTYHKNKWNKEQKKRYREYSNRRRRDEEQKKYMDFYNSSAWRRLRNVVVNKYYGMDILEYYRTGRVVQGEAVHHIVCVSEDWNRRLDINNLIYLTECTHRRVHAKYEKGKKEKEKMQKILFALVEKFEEELG